MSLHACDRLGECPWAFPSRPRFAAAGSLRWVARVLPRPVLAALALAQRLFVALASRFVLRCLPRVVGAALAACTAAWLRVKPFALPLSPAFWFCAGPWGPARSGCRPLRILPWVRLLASAAPRWPGLAARLLPPLLGCSGWSWLVLLGWNAALGGSPKAPLDSPLTQRTEADMWQTSRLLGDLPLIP